MLLQSKTQEFFQLALQFHKKNQLSEAESLYLQVLFLEPKHADSLHNIAEISLRLGRYPKALIKIEEALQIVPNHSNFLNTKIAILLALNQFEEARKLSLALIKLCPNFSFAYTNLAIAEVNLQQTQQALDHFRIAIALDPNNPYAHDGLGLTLLLLGHLQEGWKEEEWRWKKQEVPPNRYPNTTPWKGENLQGKTLLIYLEQGKGDVFQFFRYVSLLCAKGVNVLVEDFPEASKLLWRSLPPNAEIFDSKKPKYFDYSCALMSVAWRYGTTLESIPANIPYLKPHPQTVKAWQSSLRQDSSFKVGIVWAGSPSHANDCNRSITLDEFAPLFEIPGITLYSLQKDLPASQVQTSILGNRLVDLSKKLIDFDETAAVLQHLDLVICVDTAIAHLAGALGSNVWTLLPFRPDWRWLLERSDTPWYPTMRLFRQPSLGNWRDVMQQVKSSLEKLLSSRS